MHSVRILLWFIVTNLYTIILQGYFTGLEAFILYLWSNPEEYG